MKYFTTIFASLFLLMSCSQDTPDLQNFTSPLGGTYAIRLPDQIQVAENSFFYEIRIDNVENEYSEVKRFKLERMNFHPFTPVFAEFELEYLYFSYFNYPHKLRESAYEYLAEWDAKVKNNPNLFKISESIVFALCRLQDIEDNKVVSTLYMRRNNADEFIKIYDDLQQFDNLIKPTIGYHAAC